MVLVGGRPYNNYKPTTIHKLYIAFKPTKYIRLKTNRKIQVFQNKTLRKIWAANDNKHNQELKELSEGPLIKSQPWKTCWKKHLREEDLEED